MSKATSGLYLSFHCQEKLFAIPAVYVSEVIEFSNVKPYPRQPEEVCGLIHLRGDVLPVIHLGNRLSLGAEVEPQVIIVISDSGNNNSHPYSLATDGVAKAVKIEDNEISHSEMGSELRTDFVDGVGKFNGQFMPLLNLHKVADPLELSKIIGAAAAVG